MPNRIIKESINESKSLSECCIAAQDLYKRLITYSDDYGRFNADTLIMFARLYPREMDSITREDVEEWLVELVGTEKITMYRCAVQKNEIYGFMNGWAEHQRIRDSKHKYPDPEEELNDLYHKRFIPISLKLFLLERDSCKCQLCGKQLNPSGERLKRLLKISNGSIHFDHIVPVVNGGRVTEENLRVLCSKCNLSRKRLYTSEEILAELSGSCVQVAASCGELRPNPIRIQSVSKSESKSNLCGGFEEFWQLYPKKTAKAQAEKSFEKINPDRELIDTILKAVEEQKRSKQWLKDEGQFIPMPATWLNQRRWEDVVQIDTKPQLTPQQEEDMRAIFG